MYTTRPLSLYKNAPEAISLPPEGPSSGYLVLQDEESTPTCCFGLCKNPSIKDLPFPQNKLLTIEYHDHSNQGGYHTYDKVYLIPVVNQPLSSNRYYAIKADRKRKGEAYASSKEEDMGTCCFFFPCVRDVKPRPFDPDDIYQQFEFSTKNTCTNSKMLVAKSVAPDGHPPRFLRRHGWKMSGQTPKNFIMGEAHGLDFALRARVPGFSFPLSQESSNSVVVGKWYCPFMFIKEGTEKDQVQISAFYEMTLEQRWERFYTTQNSYGQANKAINIDVVVPTEIVRIGGNEAMQVEKNDATGVVWFKTIDGNKGAEAEVGLSRLIVERMVWEEERGGWVKGKEKQVRVVKEEEYGGMWTSYGCYVMVESFVLRRNDGSLVLTYDFRHTHQLRGNWE